MDVALIAAGCSRRGLCLRAIFQIMIGCPTNRNTDIGDAKRYLVRVATQCSLQPNHRGASSLPSIWQRVSSTVLSGWGSDSRCRVLPSCRILNRARRFWADRSSPTGGVIFIAAVMDNYLQAFDLQHVPMLWQARLPSGGQATPMTYFLEENRKQYVVIASGGHGRMGTTSGDYPLRLRTARLKV